MYLTRALLLSALIGAGLAGCSDPGELGPTNCTPPACTPAQRTYAAEVAGVQSSTFPTVEFTDLILDVESGYFALTLPESSIVTGKITAGGAPIAASVSFTRPSRIPGRPAVFYQTDVGTDGSYSLSVPPNLADEQYVIRVQPTDPAKLPPSATTAHIEGNRTLDLSVAAGEQLASLHGKIRDAVGSPIGEAKVTLRDAVTQLDVSSVGRTDASGAFAISVPFDAAALASSLVLAVERTNDKGLLSIAIELQPAEVQARLIDAPYLLQLPALPSPTQLQLRVVGAGTNGLDKPIAGASVLLRTAIADTGVLATVRAFHEVQAQTDADGLIKVDLYSNDAGAREYVLAVSPPADSEFQSSTSMIIVGTTGGVGSTTRLPLRPLVSGRVLDPTRMPLKGAVLQPSIDQTTTAQVTSLATTAKAPVGTSDDDGRFVMRVDAGTYEIGVFPPATAMLPRRWLPATAITGDLDLGDLVAPMPIKFDGVVLGPDGQTLRRSGQPVTTSVRLYLVPAGNGACDADDKGCLQAPRLQAEGTTNKDGRASLLLAADGT